MGPISFNVQVTYETRKGRVEKHYVIRADTAAAAKMLGVKKAPRGAFDVQADTTLI